MPSDGAIELVAAGTSAARRPPLRRPRGEPWKARGHGRFRDERRHVRRGWPADRAGDRRRQAGPRDQPARGRRQFPPDAQRRVPGAPRRPRPRSSPAPACTPSKDIAFATQSGPMLVIDGKLHPAFDRRRRSPAISATASASRRDGKPRFVISEDRCRWASSRASSATGSRLATRYFSTARSARCGIRPTAAATSPSPLGPMVVVFKLAASAPGRAGRARP